MPGQEQIKGSFDGTKELGRKLANIRVVGDFQLFFRK